LSFGVHTPEFAFEHDTGNVAAAIVRLGITYPVAQDNEYSTWTAYSNEYWPADYLIDATGHVRSTHFGEGDYNQTEQEIRGLLAEAGSSAMASPAPPASAPPFVMNQTQETYIGTDRANTFASPESAASGPKQYSFPGSLPDDTFAVSGTFDFQLQYATASAAGDKLELSFFARDVYLVAAGDTPVPTTVTVTGVDGAATTEDVAADGSMTIGRPGYTPGPSAGGRPCTVTVTFNAAGARGLLLHVRRLSPGRGARALAAVPGRLLGALDLRVEDLLELLRQAGLHTGPRASVGVAIPAPFSGRLGRRQVVVVAVHS